MTFAPTRRTLISGLALAPLVGCSGLRGEAKWPEAYPGERRLYHAAREEGLLASFDTGPNWAGWATLFEGFERRYTGVTVGYNDIGSGPGVVALERARNQPQADTFYAGAGSGIDAAARDLFVPFVPQGARRLPASLHAGDRAWHVVHALELAFLANRRLIAAPPRRFADLLDRRFAQSIVYLDPRTTAQGQAVFLAANHAAGGSYVDFTRGADYFAALDKAGSVLRVAGGTAYAQFIKGEIPVWITYASDAVRARRDDGLGDIVAMATPTDAPLRVPYVIGLVRGAPHPSAARLWLNYVFSGEGQALFAHAGAKPVIGGGLDSATMLPIAVAAATRAPVAAAWAASLDR